MVVGKKATHLIKPTHTTKATHTNTQTHRQRAAKASQRVPDLPQPCGQCYTQSTSIGAMAALSFLPSSSLPPLAMSLSLILEPPAVMPTVTSSAATASSSCSLLGCARSCSHQNMAYTYLIWFHDERTLIVCHFSMQPHPPSPSLCPSFTVAACRTPAALLLCFL